MLDKNHFASLIKETLLYFRQEGIYASEAEPQEFKKIDKPSLPSPKITQNEPAFDETEKPPVKVSSLPPKAEKKSQKTNWELNALKPPLESTSFKEQFGQFFKFQHLEVPVKLVLPEENDACRLFLENVSRAITKNFAPSAVETALYQDGSVKLVLAPLSFLRKRFPKFSGIHHVYQTDKTSFLAMEEIERYLVDRNLKLLLWQTIKTSLPSLLSQNMP